MMESVASALLRTRSAGEGVCDWAGVNFGTRKRADTKMTTMDFLIVVARFMVGSPRWRSDVRGYCKGILELRERVDGEKLKSRKMPGSRPDRDSFGQVLGRSKAPVRSRECLRVAMVSGIRTKACPKSLKSFPSGASPVFRKRARGVWERRRERG